jgi:hypothetical protein
MGFTGRREQWAPKHFGLGDGPFPAAQRNRRPPRAHNKATPAAAPSRSRPFSSTTPCPVAPLRSLPHRRGRASPEPPLYPRPRPLFGSPSRPRPWLPPPSPTPRPSPPPRTPAPRPRPWPPPTRTRPTSWPPSSAVAHAEPEVGDLPPPTNHHHQPTGANLPFFYSSRVDVRILPRFSPPLSLLLNASCIAFCSG